MLVHWNTHRLLTDQLERLQARQEQYRNPRFVRFDVERRLAREKVTINELRGILSTLEVSK